MTRPELNPIPLNEVLPIRPATGYMTMSVGQWDSLLQSAYFEGFVLIEVDNDEKPIRAYQILEALH